jgi:hypothetical protein
MATSLAFSPQFETHETRNAASRDRRETRAPYKLRQLEVQDMYQLFGAAICVAGVALALAKDPIMGLLLVLCAIIWAASTPTVAPFRRAPKASMLIPLE